MRRLQKISHEAGEAGLPFLVIGGDAVLAHGYVRSTDDLDLLVQRSHRPDWKQLLEGLISINRLDLNEPELRATILKHGNQELLGVGRTAAERRKLLEEESAELQQQADKLAEEIKELGGETPSRIV